MTTVHKQNPFGILDADSEGDEDLQINVKPKKPKNVTKPDIPPGDKVKQRNVEITASKKNDEPKDRTQGVPRAVTQGEKEKNIRQKEERKIKGVQAEPHPNDRHSGTGINPWEKKPKRAGGGKYNVGTIQDELKLGEEVQTAPTEEQTPAPEPEKDEGITLEEYYKKQGLVQQENSPTINENKAKITPDQLIKELGTAKPLQTKLQTQIDDKEISKKKKGGAEHAVGINTEHADLLGFKTGFRLYVDRPQEKRPAPPQQAEGAEGEQQQQPKAAEPQEGTEQQQQPGQTEQQGRKPTGGYKRGGYKGGRREGGAPSKNNEQKGVNVENDKDFPKLG